jgi:hypothetical protein
MGAGDTQSATADTRPGGGLGNPLDPDGNRDPWGKYKWFILAGFVLLLAIGAGFMLRKPGSAPIAHGTAPLDPTVANPVYASTTQAYRPAAPVSADQQTLAAMKEELFALETERLQKRITEEEYLEHKAALEKVLRRALNRSGNPAASDASSGPSNPTGAA